MDPYDPADTLETDETDDPPTLQRERFGSPALEAPASAADPSAPDAMANVQTVAAFEMDALLPAGALGAYEAVVFGTQAYADSLDADTIAAANAVVMPSSRPPPDLAEQMQAYERRIGHRRRQAIFLLLASTISGGAFGALYKVLGL
jgi:hypothetical protein